MGITVYVYRDASGSDCTNGGVSAKVKRLTITNVEGPFKPDAEAPAAVLEKGPRGSVRIKPVELVDCQDKVVMFGGNYAASSDSRFVRAVEQMLGHDFYGAVAIHDRAEG